VSSTPAGINCGATCSATYASNTAVTLTAMPAAGSAFVGWTGGGCSGTAPCQVTLTADITVTATFGAASQSYSLTVSRAGTGSGSVASNPSGINCEPTCSATYASGTAVTLSATPAAGSTFAGWTGGGCGGTAPCRVTLAANTTVTASFTSGTATSPADLVAAYSFNQGSGNTVADASGKGNTGTLSGATWTTGRFGGALSFDGVNASVTVADAPALDLTTGMTLSAWVYPTVAPAGWRTVILKEQPGQLVYSLYASSDTNQPSSHIGVSQDLGFNAGSRLPANTWTYLTATYDGSMLRLYVNGVQVGSLALSGGIRTSGGALRIGGNSVWGEYFQGRIDEVRIYNRALTATEIQSDMNTPISP
jgi:hypothetical protein